MENIFKILLLFLAVDLTAQINIESAKLHKIIDGFSGKGEAFYNFSSGNTNQYKIGSLIKLDYLKNDFETFVLFNYEKSSANNSLVSNNGYFHLRLMYQLNNFITSELFSQMEFNDFTKLKERKLIGTGLRIEPLKSYFNEDTLTIHLSIGSGFMFENELLDDIYLPKTNLIRSTNYLNFQWRPNNHTKFMTITYFQFDLSNLNDYRILNNSSLIFSINKIVKFFISANYRYDNLPPFDVKNFDIELKNGIALEF